MNELKIRNLDPSIKAQLKKMVQRYSYSSINQMMLEIIKQAVENDGLSIFDSDLVKLMNDIKKQQLKIEEILTSEMVENVKLIEELIIVKELVAGWIEYMMINEVLIEEAHLGQGELDEKE